MIIFAQICISNKWTASFLTNCLPVIFGRRGTYGTVEKIPTNNIHSVMMGVRTVRQGQVAYGPGVTAHGENRFWKMSTQVCNDYQVHKIIHNLGRVHKPLNYFSRRNHELSLPNTKFEKLCTTRIVKYFLIRQSQSTTYQGRSDERAQSTWRVLHIATRPEFTQLCRDSRFFKCVTNNYVFKVIFPFVCSKFTDKME